MGFTGAVGTLIGKMVSAAATFIPSVADSMLKGVLAQLRGIIEQKRRYVNTAY